MRTGHVIRNVATCDGCTRVRPCVRYDYIGPETAWQKAPRWFCDDCVGGLLGPSRDVPYAPAEVEEAR